MTDQPVAVPDPREEMPSPRLSRVDFETRYRSRFADPVFEPLAAEVDRIVAAAWDAYADQRKSPRTRKAGPAFADADYDLATDWLAARDMIHAAQARHEALDRDTDIQAEVRIAAEELARAIVARRRGELVRTDRGLESPRQK